MGRFYTLESDTYRRQILTYLVVPRAERVKLPAIERFTLCLAGLSRRMNGFILTLMTIVIPGTIRPEHNGAVRKATVFQH